MRQPTFFDKDEARRATDAEQMVLHALGDFQSRGKVLAERDLPLDRLRGALKRAASLFDVEELTDEAAVATLRALGADVRQVPSFVAKHPFRVVVHTELARRALDSYREALSKAQQAG